MSFSQPLGNTIRHNQTKFSTKTQRASWYSRNEFTRTPLNIKIPSTSRPVYFNTTYIPNNYQHHIRRLAFQNIATEFIKKKEQLEREDIKKYWMEGWRALVVKCFPWTHRKVTGSNHSWFAIHEFSFGLLVRILPSAFSLPAFMYSA